MPPSLPPSLPRSVQALKVLQDEVQCDVIKVGVWVDVRACKGTHAWALCGKPAAMPRCAASPRSARVCNTLLYSCARSC